MQKKYELSSGQVVEYTDIPTNYGMDDLYSKIFKINLPWKKKDFTSGNGEGVWVIPSDEAKEAWDKDVLGGIHVARICNYSLSYPELHDGDLIVIEMRGCNRPVAIYSELVKKYGKSKYEEGFVGPENKKKKREKGRT